ncbi:hypothetical protein [Candidatus Nitrospira bockiana]
MSTLATFETLFDNRVRDAAARFTVAQKDDAIFQAVKRYATIRPVLAVQDYAGDGATYDFALPSGWVAEFSTIRALEYPADQRKPSLLEDDEWQFYQTTAGTKLRLLDTTPATGKTLRVTFTKLHVVDANGSTIPAHDEEAVADLAAAIGLRALAAIYSGTVDATLAADTVDYKSKAAEYSKRADELEARWRDHLGLDRESDAKAASHFIDVDQTDSLGRDKLTHPNRYR